MVIICIMLFLVCCLAGECIGATWRANHKKLTYLQKWLPYNPSAKRSETPSSLQEIRFDDPLPEWQVAMNVTRSAAPMMENEKDLKILARLRPQKIRWREPSANWACGQRCHEHHKSKTQMETENYLNCELDCATLVFVVIVATVVVIIVDVTAIICVCWHVG